MITRNLINKTRFTLKQYGSDQFYDKKFRKVEKAFEQKQKLEKKTNQEWLVVALTPFGNTIVLEDELWKWR